jgi:hypothetical protein
LYINVSCLRKNFLSFGKNVVLKCKIFPEKHGLTGGCEYTRREKGPLEQGTHEEFKWQEGTVAMWQSGYWSNVAVKQ